MPCQEDFIELIENTPDHQKQYYEDGYPALVQAGRNGNTAVAEALLAARANVNATDLLGYTALHWAGRRGQMATAQALLAAGAHTEAKTNIGKPALYYTRGETRCLRRQRRSAILCRGQSEANSRPPTRATWIAWLRPSLGPRCTQNILDSKASVDKPNKPNATAFMLAAQHGHTEVGRLLLARKADVNATDQHGDTALHLALRHGHFPTAEVLVAAGGDITARNKCFSVNG
eukprot:g64663.t1